MELLHPLMITDAFSAPLFNRVPEGFLCIVFVLYIVLLSEAGLTAFNLWNLDKKLPQNNEVAGFMFGAVTLVYSLILAFVFVAVWEDYEDLNQTVETEADKLNSILSHSATLPDSIRQSISTALHAYCIQVIDKEWKMKLPNEEDHPSAIPALRMMLLKIEPQSKTEESIYAVLDDDLSGISSLRRNRLSHNRSRVPDLVWFIIKAGSIMMISFSYLFHVPSVAFKRIYLFFFSTCLGMCMYLVYTLDHPFDKHSQLSRHPYENLLKELRQYDTVSNK